MANRGVLNSRLALNTCHSVARDQGGYSAAIAGLAGGIDWMKQAEERR
jgi:hypothetical protein